MMRIIQPFVLLVVLVVTGNACTKEPIHLNLHISLVSPGSKFRAIFWLNADTGFIAGGEIDQSGFILQTLDGGQSWNLVLQTSWCLYDIGFLDESAGLACGDSLRIIQSTDAGFSWEPLPLSWYPAVEYHLPLKHMELVNDTSWYFTGGRYYERGVNIRTRNGGLWTDVTVFQVELNTGSFRNPFIGWIGGYGIIYQTENAAVDFYPVDFQGDNFTGICFTGEMTGLVCGFNGGIYKTTNGGQLWKPVHSPNASLGKRIHFTDIIMHGNLGVAVGMNGIIRVSADRGDTWKAVKTGFDFNLRNVVRAPDGSFMICGDDGTIITLWF